MMSAPAVSVILPVRNGQGFIEESIESILKQTVDTWELIIVDNGSSDDTKDLCRSFIDRRIVITDNPGSKTIATALNWGLDLARGSLIARIDADDIALPHRLERQIEFLQGNPDIGIVGTWMELFGDRRVTWRYPVSNADIQLNMFFSNPFGHPSVMYRKNWCQGSLGYYDPAFDLAEDYELWTRISREWRCANLPEVLTLYRAHPSQSTKEDSRARAICVSRIREAHCRYWGIRPLTNDSSYRALAKWLSDMESSLAAIPNFADADFDRLRKSQLIFLGRRKLAAVLEGLGFRKLIIKARALVEKLTHQKL